MSRTRGPKRVGSLSSLANILPEVCEGLKLDEKINEMALLALWPKQVEAIAGSHAAQNSRAVRLKKQGYQTILLARVNQAALASELGFHLPLIKEALNRFTPQTGFTVDQIQLTVGSL
jgi:hypothetical protein